MESTQYDASGFDPIVIKIIGVGGAGGSAIRYMAGQGMQGVHLICADTDGQDLDKCKECGNIDRISLGGELKRGAGGKPEQGLKAMEDNQEAICKRLEGTDFLFIVGGMGGGTGTGAIPKVAELAKSRRILNVSVVFRSARPNVAVMAKDGLDALRQYSNSIILVDNNKIRSTYPGMLSKPAYEKADEILCGAVQAIFDIIANTGDINNIDFEDVKAVMSESGQAVIGIGTGEGENCVHDALREAFLHPLIERPSLSRAKAIISNLTTNKQIPMDKIAGLSRYIRKASVEDARIFSGIKWDASMPDNHCTITIIATGITEEAPANISRFVDSNRSSLPYFQVTS